jgi:hypothetical protein
LPVFQKNITPSLGVVCRQSSKARPAYRQAGTNETNRVNYIRLLVKPTHKARHNTSSGVNQFIIQSGLKSFIIESNNPGFKAGVIQRNIFLGFSPETYFTPPVCVVIGQCTIAIHQRPAYRQAGTNRVNYIHLLVKPTHKVGIIGTVAIAD